MTVYTAPHTFDLTTVSTPGPYGQYDGTYLRSAVGYDGYYSDFMVADLFLDPTVTYTFEMDFESYASGAPAAYFYSQRAVGDPDYAWNNSNWETLGSVDDPSGSGSAITLTLTIGPGIESWDTAIADSPVESRFLFEISPDQRVSAFRMTVGVTLEGGAGGVEPTYPVDAGTATVAAGGVSAAPVPWPGTLTNLESASRLKKQKLYRYTAPISGFVLIDSWNSTSEDDYDQNGSGYGPPNRRGNVDIAVFPIAGPFTDADEIFASYYASAQVGIETNYNSAGWYEVTAGTEYLIQIGITASSPLNGVYQLTIGTVQEVAPPALNYPTGSDAFADAPAVDTGFHVYSSTNGSSFTLESGEITPNGFDDHSAWWKIIPTRDCLLVVRGVFNTVGLYEGSALGALTPLHLGKGNTENGVVHEVVGGQTYYLQMLEGYYSSTYTPYFFFLPYEKHVITPDTVYNRPFTNPSTISGIPDGNGGYAILNDSGLQTAFSATFPPTTLPDNAICLGWNLVFELEVIDNGGSYFGLSNWLYSPPGSSSRLMPVSDYYLGAPGGPMRVDVKADYGDLATLQSLREGTTYPEVSRHAGPIEVSDSQSFGSSPYNKFKITYMAYEVFFRADDVEEPCGTEDYVLHPHGVWSGGSLLGTGDWDDANDGTSNTITQTSTTPGTGFNSGSAVYAWLDPYTGPIDPEATITLDVRAQVTTTEAAGSVPLGVSVIFDSPGGGGTAPFTDLTFPGTVLIPNDGLTHDISYEVSTADYSYYGIALEQILERLSGGIGTSAGLRALRFTTAPTGLTFPASTTRSFEIFEAKLTVGIPNCVPLTSVVRQFPRDDELGWGSATRLFPTPKAQRIVGGIQ